MTDDIVTRLRNRRGSIADLCDTAVDEIERLRAIIKDCWDWETVLKNRGETL